MNVQSTVTVKRPWEVLPLDKLPGYWFLASFGKQVLRPGGIKLTRIMMDEVAIQADDVVVEYAPGMGVTAKMALDKNPLEYIAIERDEAAAAYLNQLLEFNPKYHCIQMNAADTLDLPDNCASVVYGESMLSIHNEENKQNVMNEVKRILKPGGRYAMQEITVIPDDIDPAKADAMRKEIIRSVHHPAWPYTIGQWKQFLSDNGFELQFQAQRPVELLEQERLLEDEGPEMALSFIYNLLEDPEATKRFQHMRSVFQKYKNNLCGFCAVCVKK